LLLYFALSTIPPEKFIHPFALPCGKRNEQLLWRSSIRDRSIYIETVPGVATNFITLLIPYMDGSIRDP
jgi:hypothetical protein